ncbi:hypothetical protein [Leisingera sp. F5]|uniref:hypothetical protein n=1 Tax=Leisingera sp. F5 TaxID=1813816 RepID=UPI000A8FC02A|nr:hypothetical protein [Leisingera sp. F5]
MHSYSVAEAPLSKTALSRNHTIAACLTVLTREIHTAGIETQDALDLLRDAPDKIEAALTRGRCALVIYRLDKSGARGVVSDKDSRLNHFVAVAEQEGAPLLGFCPGAIAELAVLVGAGAASVRMDS